MLDNSLIYLIRDYGLPTSPSGLMLNKIDATVQYIDQHTPVTSILHFDYKNYKKEKRFGQEYIFLYGIFLFSPMVILFVVSSYYYSDPTVLDRIFFALMFIQFMMVFGLVFLFCFHMYLRYKYASKIKMYLNYLDYKNNLEKRGVNNFDYYIAGELGLGPKVNNAYGFRFRKTKRKILRQLIDELPVENYGDAPKEGMYRNIVIHRFINHIFSIIFLLLAFRFLWLNDGKNYNFLDLLGQCFKHNWWVLVVAVILLFVRVRNTMPILEREQQIQDALQDYLKLHDQEVQKIIDNLSTSDSEDLV